MKNVPKCERCGTLPRQEEADMGDETWYCECDYVSPTARAARRMAAFDRAREREGAQVDGADFDNV